MQKELTGFEKNFLKSWVTWDQDDLTFIFMQAKLTDRLYNICKCLGMPEGEIIDVSFDLENLILEIMVYKDNEDGKMIWNQQLPVTLSV